MIQCICCEDWFHGHHLEGSVPESYGELICKDCTSKMDFLKYYREELKVTDGDSLSVEVKGEETVEDVKGSEEKATNGHDDGPDRKKLKTEQDQSEQVCKLEERRRCDQPPIDGPSFWNEKWRESLCKCSSCLKMYEELKCSYLTDLEDTVHSYEERGRERNPSGGSSIEEAGQQALQTKLSSMPRAAQIEMIHGYNDLKTELTNFLRPFSERGEVVTTEHVKKFIEDFKKKKESEPKVDVYSGCH